MLWAALDQHDPYLTLTAFDCRIRGLLNNFCQSARLIVRVCKHRHRRRRYYLIENPLSVPAWNFGDILSELLSEENGGKFTVGDQCAYGKTDADSGKPVKKPTGWLSNNEPILNALGRRCKCVWGSHELVIGANSRGACSKQAAAYPRGVCQSYL
jgi:hypothetical protein